MSDEAELAPERDRSHPPEFGSRELAACIGHAGFVTYSYRNDATHQKTDREVELEKERSSWFRYSGGGIPSHDHCTRISLPRLGAGHQRKLQRGSASRSSEALDHFLRSG